MSLYLKKYNLNNLLNSKKEVIFSMVIYLSDKSQKNLINNLETKFKNIHSYNLMLNILIQEDYLLKYSNLKNYTKIDNQLNKSLMNKGKKESKVFINKTKFKILEPICPLLDLKRFDIYI